MPEFDINPEDVDPREQLRDEQTQREQEHLYEMIEKITLVMNEYYPTGIRPSELSPLIVHLLMHMRRFIRLEELHMGLHELLGVAETWLQSDAQWRSVETNETTPPPITIEKVEDNPEGMAMMEELQAGVTDEALKELLGGE